MLKLAFDLPIILLMGNIAIDGSANVQDTACLAFTQVVVLKRIPG